MKKKPTPKKAKKTNAKPPVPSITKGGLTVFLDGRVEREEPQTYCLDCDHGTLDGGCICDVSEPCPCCGDAFGCDCTCVTTTETLDQFYRKTDVVTWGQLKTTCLWFAIGAFTLFCLGSLAFVLTH